MPNLPVRDFRAVQAGSHFPSAVPETFIPAGGTAIPFGAIIMLKSYIVAPFVPATSPVMVYKPDVSGSYVKKMAGSRAGESLASILFSLRISPLNNSPDPSCCHFR